MSLAESQYRLRGGLGSPPPAPLIARGSWVTGGWLSGLSGWAGPVGSQGRKKEPLGQVPHISLTAAAWPFSGSSPASPSWGPPLVSAGAGSASQLWEGAEE